MEYNWISYIVNKTIENCGDREIVLWGKYVVSNQIATILKSKHGKSIAFYVDSDKQKQDGYFIKSPESLAGLAEKYYVVIPIAFYQSVRDSMTRYGYEKDKDYHYFCDCVIKQTEDYYEDSHGNKLIGKWQGVKFAFSGFHSTIVIGEDCELSPMTRIYVTNNSKIVIGKQARLDWGLLYALDNAEINIGDNVSISYNYNISANKNTSIFIGDDCMFSHNIEIRSNDSHSIFDVRTRKNINSTEEIRRQRKVIIKDHVWLGLNVIVMYNAVIESGSIIGAGSLVKTHIPNNSIAAGMPARVIRTDIAWCRKDGEEDISACGELYINYTELVEEK